MLVDDRKLKKQSFFISIFSTIFTCLFLFIYEIEVLKEKIKVDILPMVSQDINNLALHTQNQLQLVQFTTIQHEYLFNLLKSPTENNTDAEISSSIRSCLARITQNPDTLEFSNRKKFREGEIENNDGALLGNGSVDDFSYDEKTLLCLIVSSSQASSESLRLFKSDINKLSRYYYASRLNNYLLIYNTSFSQSFLEKYTVPKVREIFNNMNDINRNYWITNIYQSTMTKKLVISFVKNVVDYKGEITGFLVRDIYKKDFKAILTESLNKIDGHLNLNKYSSIQVLNNESIIYQSDDLNTIGKRNSDTVIESVDPGYKWSDFGALTIRLYINKSGFILLMIEEYNLLVLFPLFLYVFIYVICLQILKGFREGDKQYFDILTKTYNRNGLYSKVFKKIEKSVEAGKSAYILSLDANNFKHINDKYGHDVGDKAIKIIASAARSISEPIDDIVRLGGDEFLIVLYINSEKEFDVQKFLKRFSEKITYDCRTASLPSFTVSASSVLFNCKTQQSLSQIIKYADKVLINKKSIDKINAIYEEFNFYGINLSDKESDIKLSLNQRFDFLNVEHLLQTSLNDNLLQIYHSELNYLMSNYFNMMYSCSYENNDLHKFRMKIIDTHFNSDIPMSVFYFLFVNYSVLLFKDEKFTPEEIQVNNQILSYELHFVSNLKTR